MKIIPKFTDSDNFFIKQINITHKAFILHYTYYKNSFKG